MDDPVGEHEHVAPLAYRVIDEEAGEDEKWL